MRRWPSSAGTSRLEDDEEVAARSTPRSSCLSVLGILAFAAVVVFAIFLPDIITSIPKSLVGQAQFLLLLLAFDMALSIPMDTFGGALSAMQRFDLLNYSLIAVDGGAGGRLGRRPVVHGGLIALGVVTVAISLVGQLARLIMVHRLLPWFQPLAAPLRPQHPPDASPRHGLVLHCAGLPSGDRSVRRPRSSALSRACGRPPSTPSRNGWPLLHSASSNRGAFVVFAKAGQLAARDDRRALRGMTDDVVRFVQYLSIPAAIVLGFLAGPAVEVWVGPLYREAAPVVGLLCVAAVVQAWALAIRLAINGAGRPRLAAVLYGSEAVFHVGLGIVLAARYGAIGHGRGGADRRGPDGRDAHVAAGVPADRRLVAAAARRTWPGSWACPLSSPAASPGWSGGAAVRSTSSRTRMAGSSGLVVVVVAGTALMLVFYALLLVSLPGQERRVALGSCAGRTGPCPGQAALECVAA